ncbi:MAG TPA: GAF domain-containing protein [Arenibaculum sp.]|nr:GAF domain-containing protein [Arenibaculum sp.]
MVRFARFIARARDAEQLWQALTQAVQAGTEADHVLALETVPERFEFRVRAFAGKPPHLQTGSTISAGLRSPAGFAWQSGRPLAIADAGREKRLLVRGDLLAAGVRSLSAIPISGRHRSYGIIESCSLRRNAFSRQDVEFVGMLGDLFAVGLDLNAGDRLMAEMLDFHTGRLHHVEHTARSDLQFVLTMLDLQRRAAPDPTMRKALDMLGARIEPLRLARALTSSKDEERLDLACYVAELCASLRAILGDGPAGSGSDLAGPLTSSPDLALVLGTVIVETVLALHSGESGTRGDSGHGQIRIVLGRPAPDRARLSVIGARVPAMASHIVRIAAQSFGMNLVDTPTGPGFIIDFTC